EPHLVTACREEPGRRAHREEVQEGAFVRLSTRASPSAVRRGISGRAGWHVPGPRSRQGTGATGVVGAGHVAAGGYGRVRRGRGRVRGNGPQVANATRLPRRGGGTVLAGHALQLSRAVDSGGFGPALARTDRGAREGNPWLRLQGAPGGVRRIATVWSGSRRGHLQFDRSRGSRPRHVGGPEARHQRRGGRPTRRYSAAHGY